MMANHKRIRINVTQRDIARHGRSARDCPVAMAMTRSQLGEGSVYQDGFYLKEESFRNYHRWSDFTEFDIGTWINQYDRGLIVEPISFEVEI